MKKETIVKGISFICIPIFIIIVVLSLFAVYVKNGTEYNEDKYYSSNSFIRSYMTDLSNICNDLIYNNEEYFNSNDGENKIYYTNRQSYSTNIQDFKYIIIYNNKAITNIEISEELKTIAGIKEYIKNLSGYKKVNLVNGIIEADNNDIKKKVTPYLEDNFTITYYTKENNKNVYHTTKYNDFEIYSSYEEGFSQNSKEKAISIMLEKVPLVNKVCYILIPVGSILAMLMIIFLIISIGEDGKLNYFDKIPLEIVIIAFICIGTIPFIFLSNYFYVTDNDYTGGISIIITIALFIYIIACIFITTLIKRLKAKQFWRTTIAGKIFYWFKDVFLKNLSYSINTTPKVILVSIGIVILSYLISILFSGLARIILLIILYGKVIHEIIKFARDCSKLEKKLEEMKNGDNSVPLNIDDFTLKFKDTAQNINNISEGIEIAVQERMKSERLKAELITNVSHDIKTPLTSIINYVDLLKKEKIENEKAKEYIFILENKSQRLKKLTEDLVEASKIQTGNVSLKKEKINVELLIKQAAGEFEDKFSKKGLDTIIESDKNEVFILADNRYMYRIIENLFSNISKYAMENSRVYIDIKTIKDKVNICIKNISKEKLNISSDELMQRFVRGDSSRTTEGSGLGLSIAQNLTTIQGGTFNLVLDGDLFKVEIIFDML